MIGVVKKNNQRPVCQQTNLKRSNKPLPKKRGGKSEGNINKNQEHNILVLSLWEKVDKGATEINRTLWEINKTRKKKGKKETEFD